MGGRKGGRVGGWEGGREGGRRERGRQGGRDGGREGGREGGMGRIPLSITLYMIRGFEIRLIVLCVLMIRKLPFLESDVAILLLSIKLVTTLIRFSFDGGTH